MMAVSVSFEETMAKSAIIKQSAVVPEHDDY